MFLSGVRMSVKAPNSTGHYLEQSRERYFPGLLRARLLVFFFLLWSASSCYSAEVLFIRAAAGSSSEQEQLEQAANFYGINLQVIVAGSSQNSMLRSLAEQEKTLGVVIAANALGAVDRHGLMSALRRKHGASVPVLVLGVTPDVDRVLLKAWSGEADVRCRQLEELFHAQYAFTRVDGLTGQLATLEIPSSAKSVSYLDLGQNREAQQIMAVREGLKVLPVFIEAAVEGSKVFLASAVPTSEGTDGEGVVSAFLRIAPAMIFVRYCAGERAWHAPGHFANFTIDDPWLREPYGFVNYKDLFGEMEKHGFHTTIAFIPWNYDRSQAEVVSLFRSHPDRFSISIHGDNHDHKEFTDYGSKPLAVQTAALKQSLARMAIFQSATGIPYDKVMVFPHSVAPEETFDALKTYNYLATVNSTNVPQGSDKPLDPAFDLRPVTLSYAGLPSISRYSVAAPIPKRLIGINEFLGNPLLFYGHADFFASGIDAFDHIADAVNELAPDTKWRSLGEVAKHLYLLRRRDDSSFDVLSFSNSICLENVSDRDSTFYVKKQEFGPQAIRSLTVDGQPSEYRLDQGYLDFRVAVPGGAVRCTDLEYQNDLNLAAIDPSRASPIVYTLRKASDFRDIYLSRFALGRAVTSLYYRYKGNTGLRVFGLFVIVVGCACLGYWFFVWRRRMQTERMQNTLREKDAARDRSHDRGTAGHLRTHGETPDTAH